MREASIVLTTGTKIVNKEEIVSSTQSEDSVAVSFLTMRIHKDMYSVCFELFLLVQKTEILWATEIMSSN